MLALLLVALQGWTYAGYDPALPTPPPALRPSEIERARDTLADLRAEIARARSELDAVRVAPTPPPPPAAPAVGWHVVNGRSRFGYWAAPRFFQEVAAPAPVAPAASSACYTDRRGRRVCPR